MKKTALIVLTSGEHLIGQIEEEHVDGEDLMIDQPVSIMPDQNKPGSILFIEYFQFSEETRDMFKADVIRHILTPKDALASAYNEKYGTGIITSAKPGFKLA